MTTESKIDPIRLKLIEILQKQASAGQFENISDVLNEVIDLSMKKYLLKKLPAIILNQYLFKLKILDDNQLQKWQESHNSWADQIKEQALDATKLRTVINRLVLSMKSFEQT